MVLIGKALLLSALLLNLKSYAGYLSVDRNVIEPEDYLQLTLTLEGDEELVSIKNIEHFIVESQSQSSNYRYINGKASSEKKITYELTLKDPNKKSINIGPAILKLDGKNIETNQILIRTIGEQAKKNAKGANADKGYSLRVDFPRDELMLNETVEFKLKFFNRVKLIEASIEVPQSEEFFIDQKGKEKNYRQIINGKEYTVTEITYKFTPLVKGAMVIPSFKINGLAVIPDKRRRNMGIGGFFEDSFFNSSFGKRKRIRVKSDPVSVEILDFPAKDKPFDFDGIVGDFELSERLQKVPQNNSYRLKISINGKGDLSTLSKLNFESSDSFSVYEEESSSTNLGKSFTLVIIPKRNGTFSLPKGRFSFFSLKEKKYKSLVFGGQELIFQGVNASANKTVSKKKNEQRVSNETVKPDREKQYFQSQSAEIIVSKNFDILEKVTLFVEKWFSVLMTILVGFFFYNVFNNQIFSILKRKLKSRKNPMAIKLNEIFGKDEFQPNDLINWLYELRKNNSGSLVSSIEDLKNDPTLDDSIKDSISKLEGSIYGGNQISRSELLVMRPNFEKLCREEKR